MKTEEALGHSSTLRELGASLESELEPSIVDLQDRSVTLSGTVDDQYQEWRRILGEMFRLEEGDITQSNNEANLNIESKESQNQDIPVNEPSETTL